MPKGWLWGFVNVTVGIFVSKYNTKLLLPSEVLVIRILYLFDARVI